MKSKFEQEKVTRITQCGLWLALTASCNSLPPYHHALYEITSNCDGDVKFVLEQDTDPRELTAKLDERSAALPDAKKIDGLKAVEKYLEVSFTSGAWCRFFVDATEGECFSAPQSQTRAACSATRKEIAILPPSHDDGF